jgi:hypothetical protein
MHARAKKYLWTLGAVLFAGVAGVVAFNLLVDPFGAYPPAASRKLEPYRSGVVTREAKAELAARGHFDTLLIGSSRIRMGLPTDHPAYGSTNVCNLGLDGTTLDEIAGVLDFALKKNSVRRVILGADFHLFSQTRGREPTYEVSRFNPALDLAEYHGRNLLGARALGESWPLFKDWIRDRPPLIGDRGWVPKYLPERASQREAFAKRLRATMAALATEGSFIRNEDCFATFRRMVRRCRQGGVELIVIVPPMHALQLEVVHATGKWSNYEVWKREVMQVLAEEGATDSVPFWDFQGFAGAVTEPVPSEGDRQTRMKYYLEASHFTRALGAKVLERVLQPATNEVGKTNFGVRITPSNLETHLLRIRVDRDDYARQNPAEIAWVKSIADAAKNTASGEGGEGVP